MKPLIFWIIVLTESGGVNSAVGDNGKSAGPAQISMADLMLWALDEIDDAELAVRLDYQPPLAPRPVSTD